VGDMEINEQADSNAAQPHVRQKLRLVDWMNRFNALHFDDYELFDDEVDPVPKLDSFSVENYRQPDLAGNYEPALSKFMSKTSLIGAFQQTRAEHGVNVHGGRHDSSRNLVDANRLEGWRRSNHSN
jgi:hypothetical protein